MTPRWLIVLMIAVAAEAATAQKTATLQTEREKVSYALGLNLAKQLQAASLEVDPDVLGRGLKDALAGSPALLTELEARVIIANLQKALKQSKSSVASGRIGARQPRAENSGTTGEAVQIENNSSRRLVVSFKPDPRLATGSYGGPRWVSPPTYIRLGDEKTCAVESRVQGLDSAGRSVAIKPQWTSRNSEIVTVTPDEGDEVRILVHRPGQTIVRVTAAELSTELTITGEYQNGLLQASISSR
jgi:hypothetical protein